MRQNEVIERFCALQKKVHDHIGYETAADCFCHMSSGLPRDYQNQGKALEFIEKAVLSAIEEATQ